MAVADRSYQAHGRLWGPRWHGGWEKNSDWTSTCRAAAVSQACSAWTSIMNQPPQHWPPRRRDTRRQIAMTSTKNSTRAYVPPTPTPTCPPIAGLLAASSRALPPCFFWPVLQKSEAKPLHAVWLHSLRRDNDKEHELANDTKHELTNDT